MEVYALVARSVLSPFVPSASRIQEAIEKKVPFFAAGSLVRLSMPTTEIKKGGRNR